MAYAGTVHPGPFGDRWEVKQSQAAAVSLLTSGMGREGQDWLSSSHWNPLDDHALSWPLSRQEDELVAMFPGYSDIWDWGT